VAAGRTSRRPPAPLHAFTQLPHGEPAELEAMYSDQKSECKSLTLELLQRRSALCGNFQSGFFKPLHDLCDSDGRSAAQWALPIDLVRPMAAGLPTSSLPESLAGAAPDRTVSFVAGPLCMERCLRDLGLPWVGVGRDASGKPQLPLGIVGSISHSSNTAWAAAFRAQATVGLGVDHELLLRGDMCDAVVRWCTTPTERSWLTVCGTFEPGLALIFSAKVAHFKASYPLVDQMVDFVDAQIEQIDLTCRSFAVRPVADRAMAGVLPDACGRFSFEGQGVYGWSEQVPPPLPSS
jgi:enterobactin synthetase component D